MKYHKRVGIAIDQLFNALLAGWPDETLSSRAWRKREVKWWWRAAQVLIDAVFFWQKNHCRKSYIREMRRMQGPHEFRD